MSPPPEIVVIGGANIDYTVRGDTLPSPRHTVAGDCFLRDAGGKGLNQAVAAARLGARATLVACLGQDHAGDDVLGVLRDEAVDASAVARVPQLQTGRTLICVDTQGRKQTAWHPGANLVLTEDRIPDGILARAPVILAQLEIPVETVLHAARFAERCGVTFVLDAGPARDLPDELLALTSLLTANEDEAAVLSRVAVQDRDSAFAAARAIARRGPKSVAVGSATGRAVVSGGAELWLPNHDVTVVDTTGAGDACSAAIAVSLASGRSVFDASEVGHAAAALATTRVGARASQPSAAEVEALLGHRLRA